MPALRLIAPPALHETTALLADATLRYSVQQMWPSACPQVVD